MRHDRWESQLRKAVIALAKEHGLSVADVIRHGISLCDELLRKENR